LKSPVHLFRQMLEQIQKELAATSTTLVAVSKTKPNDAIFRLYEQGQRIFGENRVQELIQKYDTLPKDIDWHFIGHLQSNKVKNIAPFVQLIHSVDSLKLLSEINKQAAKHERIIDCLLQIHIADESTKFGLNKTETLTLLNSDTYTAMQNIRITGVMGMATFTDDTSQVRREFRQLKDLFDQLKSEFFIKENTFKEISMGMSGDYQIAIEEGSTMIRIGSLLFGLRN